MTRQTLICTAVLIFTLDHHPDLHANFSTAVDMHTAKTCWFRFERQIFGKISIFGEKISLNGSPPAMRGARATGFHRRIYIGTPLCPFAQFAAPSSTLSAMPLCSRVCEGETYGSCQCKQVEPRHQTWDGKDAWARLSKVHVAHIGMD